MIRLQTCERNGEKYLADAFLNFSDFIEAILWVESNFAVFKNR